jgi:thiol-disulfide isomerase/thioredoxin
MENNKRTIAIVIRILIAFLFLLSAVAKLYPSPYFAISTFEVKQLYTMGFSEGFAPYFSRTLIGIEFALGLLLLQPHYLKRFVIPATIAMHVVFIAHLTIDTISNGNSGSCGCFGELLPMTPVEAIIKNVISVVLLIWLYRLLPSDYTNKNFWVLTTVLFACILGVFMAAPIQPVQSVQPDLSGIPAAEADTVFVEESDIIPADTTNRAVAPQEAPQADTQQQQATPVTTPVAVNEPAKVKSVYSQYFPNADKGKKIIALFAPGCEHCRDAAKELTALKAKNKDFPELQIIFMDEEANLIPDFFKYAGAKYPYKVLDIITFWKVLGNDKDTPGIVYLWNGNIMKDWNGINDKQFVASELEKAYKKPYTK